MLLFELMEKTSRCLGVILYYLMTPQSCLNLLQKTPFFPNENIHTKPVHIVCFDNIFNSHYSQGSACQGIASQYQWPFAFMYSFWILTDLLTYHSKWHQDQNWLSTEAIWELHWFQSVHKRVIARVLQHLQLYGVPLWNSYTHRVIIILYLFI